MTKIVILIPAAGASSRMKGRDKLLETIQGKPLLAHQVGVACATGCDVLVTLPKDNPRRQRVLGADRRVQTHVIPDPAKGLSQSLRAGAKWAQDRQADGLMVVLADLPELTTTDLIRMAQAFRDAPQRVLRATDQQGGLGHPVLLPSRLFEAMRTLSGDTGAARLLGAEPVRTLALPGQRATTDLDTPEAWARWRAQNR